MEVHDLGCQCWPHVSEKDALACIVNAATKEYREGLRRAEAAPSAGLPAEALREALTVLEKHANRVILRLGWPRVPKKERDDELLKLQIAADHARAVLAAAPEAGPSESWLARGDYPHPLKTDPATPEAGLPDGDVDKHFGHDR